jgi:hypothetical protein
MYAALDATGLMLSKDAAGMSPDQINARATQIFNAEFNRPDVSGTQVTAVLSSPQAGSFTPLVTASGNLPATFTRVFGQSQIALNGNADFNWGIKKLELALDNTGSMGQSGKLTQLKTAAIDARAALACTNAKNTNIKIFIRCG